MMPVVPGARPNDTQGTLAILDVISTDSKYKARLQELVEATEKANEAINNLRMNEKAASVKLEAAESMYASIVEEANQIQEAAQAAQQEVEAAQADLAEREEALQAAIKLHNETSEMYNKELAATWKQFNTEKQEHEVAWKDSVDKETAKFDARKAELDTYAAKLSAHEAKLEDLLNKNQAEADQTTKLKEELTAAMNKIKSATAGLAA
jgi:chromosome segregation ATPase